MFQFDSVGKTCDILENALTRYKQMITIQLRRVRSRVDTAPFDKKWRSVPEYQGHLDSVKVDLRSQCDKMPYLGMDESCEFDFNR